MKDSSNDREKWRVGGGGDSFNFLMPKVHTHTHTHAHDVIVFKGCHKSGTRDGRSQKNPGNGLYLLPLVAFHGDYREDLLIQSIFDSIFVIFLSPPPFYNNYEVN